MKNKTTVFIAFLFFFGIASHAQSFFTPDDHLVNGFANKVSGLDFEYTSCIPGSKESLLLRATSGKDFMEWVTDPAPEGIKEKYATFIWIAALGSGPGRAAMDWLLMANNILLFTPMHAPNGKLTEMMACP